MKKVEVSYKEVAIAILRRWYVVLIVAVAFAYVYSNVEYSKRLAEYEQELLVYEDAKEAYNKALTEYQKASAEYLRDLDKNKQMAKDLKAQIAYVEDYLRDGIRPNVDPYNFASATLTMVVDSEISNQILNRATNHYFALAQDAPFDTILENVIPEGYNPTYVADAMTFKRVDNDLLVITAIGTDKIDPQAVVQAVVDYLISQKDVVTRSAGEHTFTLMNEGPRRSADLTLVNVRVNQENRLIALKRRLDETEKAIKSNPTKSVEKYAKEGLPEEPIKPVRPPRPIQIEANGGEADSSFSYWMKGILGGVVLGALLVMICYLIRLPIQYPMQLQKQLGMRYLGGKSGGDKTLKEAELIAANLQEVAQSLQTVLLTGRLPEDTLSAVAKQLQGQDQLKDHQLIIGVDVMNNPETVTKLGQADGAVLVVKQYHSKLRDINSDMERITHSDKPLAGYIVI